MLPYQGDLEQAANPPETPGLQRHVMVSLQRICEVFCHCAWNCALFFSEEARVPYSSLQPTFSHVASCSILCWPIQYITYIRGLWLRGVKRAATLSVGWWQNIGKSHSLTCSSHCVSRSLVHLPSGLWRPVFYFLRMVPVLFLSCHKT